MVGDFLFYVAVTISSLALLFIYIIFGLVFSEYIVDDLLVYILTEYNEDKMNLLYMRHYKALDWFQLFLTIFIPIAVVVMVILWIVKRIMKSRGKL